MTSTSPTRNVRAFFRAELPLFISLGSVLILLCTGNRLVDDISHPLWLLAVFIWLFATVFWAAISVVRHADCLAILCGEPYGTLILTLSAISIEVMMIAAMMLHGANNPTLARDTMFSVIMIVLCGLLGFALLLGGLRHREQQYNLQGTNAYLNVIITLAVLGLVFPNYTKSTVGPTFSTPQQIFLIIASLGLYGIFLLIQTMRHSQFFMEPKEVPLPLEDAHHLVPRSKLYHSILLGVYLVAVVFLAEKLALPLDDGVEDFGLPKGIAGVVVAALVLAPEAMSAIHAVFYNHLQRSMNILLGTALSTIGLTIPCVLIIGLLTHHAVVLGVHGANMPLLLLTLAACVVTFGSGKTNILQGCIHLLLFGVFLLLIFNP